MANPHDQQPNQQPNYLQSNYPQQPDQQPSPVNQQPSAYPDPKPVYTQQPPAANPFAGAAQPQQHVPPQRPAGTDSGSGISLRPGQWAGIIGIIALFLGMIIGGTIGLVIAAIAAVAVVAGIADAVKKIIDERRNGH